MLLSDQVLKKLIKKNTDNEKEKQNAVNHKDVQCKVYNFSLVVNIRKSQYQHKQPINEMY